MDSSSFAVKDGYQGRYYNRNDRSDSRRVDTSNLTCDHSKAKGHSKDTCFKIHDYPDQFKRLKDSKGKSSIRNSANLADSQPEINKDELTSPEKFKELKRQELGELLRGKMTLNNINMVQFDHFVGTSTFSYALNIIDMTNLNSWIIDTGASNHMCCNKHIMHNLKHIANIKHVTFPDGSVKKVNFVGDVMLSDNIILNETLFIPAFRYNHLSVQKLAETSLLKVIFYSLCCLLQDLQADKVFAVGRVHVRHILDENCFCKHEIEYYNKYLGCNVQVSKDNDNDSLTSIFFDQYLVILRVMLPLALV